MRRRRTLVVALATAGLLLGAACSGDDDDDAAVGGDGEPVITQPAPQATGPSTTREPLDPNDPACREVQIVLKPDITDAQREAVEEKLEAVDGVRDWRFDEGTGGAGATYWVVPESVDDQGPIGEEFAMDGVTSVVFPNQVC